MVKSNPLSILVVLILTSFYLFPFIFSFFPIANTKMILAGCGLVMFFFNMGRRNILDFGFDFMSISLLALGVSFASFFSMTINNTYDDSYLTYIVSMWVWLGGAYCVVNVMKAVHGKISVELVCRYLIAISVCHCFMAVAIDHIGALKNWVDGIMVGEKYMGVGLKGRLYSMGCALDVAGGRFATILIMAGYLLPKMYAKRHAAWYIVLLLCAMVIITTIGSMIGRTCVFGALLAIAYWGYAFFFSERLREHRSHFIKLVGGVLLVAAMGGAVLSHSNSHWKTLFKFGFEGFYSLVEKGRWETTSSNMLLDGYVFPDNAHTWIIGDGYMSGSANDPYYIGESDYGFYKNTDAGYCRFLFYFGLVGLSIFSLFFLKCCHICMQRFSNYKMMFLLLVLMNFIVWIKVSTDLFVVIAPFLLISKEEEEQYGTLSINN